MWFDEPDEWEDVGKHTGKYKKGLLFSMEKTRINEEKKMNYNWMEYDKTFCGNDCANKECYRYMGNVPYGQPISIALFKGTELCEGWVSPDEEADRKEVK